jgi:hypothetical protein
VTAAGETGESLACFDEIEAAGYADDLSSPADLAAALAGALATHAGFAIDCAGDLAPRRRVIVGDDGTAVVRPPRPGR